MCVWHLTERSLRAKVTKYVGGKKASTICDYIWAAARATTFENQGRTAVLELPMLICVTLGLGSDDWALRETSRQRDHLTSECYIYSTYTFATD